MKQFVIEQMNAEEFYDLLRKKEEEGKRAGYKLGFEEAQKTDWISEVDAMKIMGCGKTKVRELRINSEIVSRRIGKQYQYSRKSCQEYKYPLNFHAENTQKKKTAFKLRP